MLHVVPVFNVSPGITLSPTALTEFITFLTQSPHSHVINFRQFRDFLLLLPRKVSTTEIYRYYEVNKIMENDGRGPARVTMEGLSPCHFILCSTNEFL
jgi:solute carrier family 25 phosphate transporter 23/24/25/41